MRRGFITGNLSKRHGSITCDINKPSEWLLQLILYTILHQLHIYYKNNEDYKITAVQYYLSKNNNQVQTCKIFKCHPRSLMCLVDKYNKKKI